MALTILRAKRSYSEVNSATSFKYLRASLQRIDGAAELAQINGV